MARIINVPGIGETTVPDSATDADVAAYVRKVAEAGGVQAAYDKALAERPGPFMSGVYGAGAGLTALGGVLADRAGADPLANSLIAQSEEFQQEAGKYVPEVASFGDIESVGDFYKYARDLTLQSIPQVAGITAGSIAGGLAGAGAGGVGAIPGAIAGGLAVGIPMYTGSNIVRQAEEQGIDIRDTDVTRAGLTALPQAAIDVIPGGSVLGRVRGVFFKSLENAGSNAARRGLIREMVTTASKTAAVEGLSETAQQGLEILQANPDKFWSMDQSVIDELLEAAVGGAVLGGIVGGTVETAASRSAAKSKAREDELKSAIQREADVGRRIDLQSQTNLGVRDLRAAQATPDLEIKQINQPVRVGTDAAGRPLMEARDVYTITDMQTGKMVQTLFPSKESAQAAVDAYKALVAQQTKAQPKAGEAVPKKAQVKQPDMGAAQPASPAGVPSPAPTAETPSMAPPKAPDTPISESPETLKRQLEATRKGNRPATLYLPSDPKPIIKGKGLGSVTFDDGRVVVFNKKLISEATIRSAVEQNRMNEVLGLGPFSKEDVVASEQRGNAPVAVVERAPDGTEIKAASGTTETAPIQLQAMEQAKVDPANTVQVENPINVLDQRVAAAAMPQPEAGPTEMSKAQEDALTKIDLAYVMSPEVNRKSAVVGAARSAAKNGSIANEQISLLEDAFADPNVSVDEIMPRIREAVLAKKAPAKKAVKIEQTPKEEVKEFKIDVNEVLAAQEKRKKKAPKKEVAEEPKLTEAEKVMDDLDHLYMNGSPKSAYRKVVKDAVKAGLMTEKQAANLEYLFKDRDMTGDDLVSEIESITRDSLEEQKKKSKKAVAPEGGGTATPAPVVLASRPELAIQFAIAANKRLKALGLGKVGFKIKTAIETDQFGRYASGAYDPVAKVIEISMSAVDPSLNEAEFVKRLSEFIDHEAIHALVDLGVMSREEFATLIRDASNTKYPGSSFSYLDRAAATYGSMLKNDDGTMDRAAVAEEAVAEMYRDWAAGRLRPQPKAEGIFKRIREFFRRLRGASKEAGYDKIFSEIDSGAMAARTPVNEVYDGKANNGMTDGVDLGVKKFAISPRAEPKKTVKAYKLFRISKEHPGKLFPLFVDANTPVAIGEWVDASMGEGYAFEGANGHWYIPSTPYMILNEKTGKYVKKTTGDSIPIPNDKVRQELIAQGFLSKDSKANTITALARRPGWHAGDSPFSTHLGTKEGGTKSEGGASVIDTRPPYQVWAEVELPADVDWQSKAIEAADRRKADDKNTGAKKGDVILKTAHITDKIPTGGFYTYKTSPTMTGAWMIGGAMKVNRVLSDAEVASINKKLGRKDLPRRAPRYDEGVVYKSADKGKKPKFAIAPSVDSAEFKRWFKNSEAVNDDGTPAVFYHGSPKPISGDELKTKDWKAISGGIPGEEGPYFFTKSKRFAEDFAMTDASKGGSGRKATRGTMYPVYLSVQNAFDYQNPDHVRQVAEKAGEEIVAKRNANPAIVIPGLERLLKNGYWNDLERKDIQRAIRDLGFDGFYLKEGNVRNLAVYSPTQVKSIFNEFKPGTAVSRKLAIAPQVSDSIQDRSGTAFSLFPYLRSKSPVYYPDHARRINSETKPSTAEKDINALDEMLAKHTNTLASQGAFAEYLADILGKSAKESTGVPLVPYMAVEYANNPKLIEEQIGSLNREQLRQANAGLSASKKLQQAYANGDATIEHTGKLLLWGILSRGVSPFVQEAMFMDVVNGKRNIVMAGKFIKDAAEGNFNLKEYMDWTDEIVPDKSAGAGSKHNLKAFGRTTLMKMQERLPNGKTLFQHLHDLIADQSLSGKEVRREFHRVNPKIGIDNKVLSFMLLVSGRDDVLVLDRVQMRNQFDDGRFEGYNLYDGEKIKTINPDGTEGKAQTVSGTAISGLGNGVMGLAYYEALERDLKPAIEAAYKALGRGKDANLGRYHWESWVASSAQEVDHNTITGIINDAQGVVNPYGNVHTSEGKYDNFLSGAKYGYTASGQPYISLTDGLGSDYVFSPADAKEVVKGYKKKSTRIIDNPDTFKVSESTTGAWYERPEVDKFALRKYLTEQVERRQRAEQPVRGATEGQPDVNRPGPRLGRFGRQRLSQADVLANRRIMARNRLSTKYAVAPAYNNVNQMTSADVDRIVEGITYGSGIKYLHDKALPYVMRGPLKQFIPSEKTLTNWKQNWFDKMIPVGQMIDYIRENGGTVTDAMDVYMKEELMHGRVGVSLGEREDGIYKDLVSYLKDNGVKLQATEAEAARGDYGIEDYLYARHAKERNERIRQLGNPDPEKGSGMTDAEADKIMAAVRNSPKRAQIEEAARLFDKIIEDTNEIRKKNGLTPDFANMDVIDEDGNAVKADMRPYKHYAPLRGLREEAAEYGEDGERDVRARVGTGFNVRGREDKRALGRKSRASDIIAHAILQNTEAVIRAHKNQVGNALVELVKTNPTQAAEFGVEMLKKAPTKLVINKDGVIQSIVDPMYKLQPDILIVKAMPDPAAGYQGGEQIVFRVTNEALQKAMIAKKVASPEIVDKILRGTQRLNRWLATINTGLNPEFMLTNFPRDLETALINVGQYDIPGIRKKILKDVRAAGMGAWRSFRDPNARGFWEDAFQDFKAHGGMTAGISGVRGIDERIRSIGKIMENPQGNAKTRAMEAVKSITGFLEDTNSAVENSIRLSLYKNLVEAGLSKERAAQAAKNLTVNFDKRGEFGATANALYLFFNASVQGTLAMGMAAARSPKVRKIFGGIVVAGMLQDVINSILSPEDDDGKNIYDKIPDYKLRNSMIIVEPFGITDRGYLSIPMPYGYNALYNMGRTLSRKLRGEYTTMEATNNIVGTFVDAFNPVGGTETLLNAVSPTVADPFISLYSNTDFTGRKIYPESFPGQTPKSNAHTSWNNTNSVFKNTAELLNWATGGGEYIKGMIDVKPDVLEYMFDFATGGVGTFVKRTYNTATDTIPKVLVGDLTNIEMNDVPFIRKVVGNVSEGIITQGYMDNASYLMSVGAELQSAIKSGDPARVKSVRETFKDELRVYPQVKALVSRRNKIASDLRKLRANDRIPINQRLKREKQMQDQMKKIMDQVNKIYEKTSANKYPSIF